MSLHCSEIQVAYISIAKTFSCQFFANMVYLAVIFLRICFSQFTSLRCSVVQVAYISIAKKSTSRIHLYRKELTTKYQL